LSLSAAARLARLHGLVELLARDVFLIEQRFHARLVGAGQIQCRRDVADVGRRLPGLRGKQRLVEFEQGLVLFHLVVEIDVELGHRAGNLGADVDQHHRIERAVGRNGLHQVALFDNLQPVAFFRGLRLMVAPVGVAAAAQGEDKYGNE